MEFYISVFITGIIYLLIRYWKIVKVLLIILGIFLVFLIVVILLATALRITLNHMGTL